MIRARIQSTNEDNNSGPLNQRLFSEPTYFVIRSNLRFFNDALYHGLREVFRHGIVEQLKALPWT